MQQRRYAETEQAGGAQGKQNAAADCQAGPGLAASQPDDQRHQAAQALLLVHHRQSQEAVTDQQLTGVENGRAVGQRDDGRIHQLDQLGVQWRREQTAAGQHADQTLFIVDHIEIDDALAQTLGADVLQRLTHVELVIERSIILTGGMQDREMQVLGLGHGGLSRKEGDGQLISARIFHPALNQTLIPFAPQAQNHSMFLRKIPLAIKDRQCPSVASMLCALPPNL